MRTTHLILAMLCNCLIFSWTLAADQLPGNKFFLVDDSKASINLLQWKQFNKKPPLPPEKYVRQKHFGVWIDFPNDHTCLTTRGLVLERESKTPIQVYPKDPCFVAQGSWFDPYTDHFYSKATEVEIDHVVPLKNAYISGAFRWPWKIRCAYFNFLGNRTHLIPIESSVNRDKSDKSIEQWLPPNQKYYCQYVSNWLRNKAIWNLMMSENEVRAIIQIVKSFRCDPNLYQMGHDELLNQRNSIREIANLCPDSPPEVYH